MNMMNINHFSWQAVYTMYFFFGLLTIVGISQKF